MQRSRLFVASGLVVAAAAIVYSGPGPNSIVIPETGQTLSCSITGPPDGSIVPFPPGTALLEGGAVVGDLAQQQVNVIYVLDVSGSTDGNGTVDADGNGMIDAGDDFNGDGEAGEILDGEISGVLALHTSIGNPSNVAVGLVGFATNSSEVDVGPAAGPQVFVQPPQADGDALGGADIAQVVRTFRSETPGGGSIALFTPVTPATLGNNTNFKAALAAMNSSLAQFPLGQNVVFFLSDGQSNTNRCIDGDCATELADAVTAGTIVNTVGVGAGADPADLQFIATATGGSFTQVNDPSDLATILPSIPPAGIDHIELNGMTVPIDALGNIAETVTCPAVGPFPLTITCFASDVDNTSISADITLDCVQIACGNGMSDPGEECEPPGSSICDANCQRIPVCGDGFVDGGETCDDGNTAGGDCCSAVCQPEPQGSPCADDGNTCTVNACNNTGMCVATNKPNNTICNDNDVCTINDACQNGVCTGGSGSDQDGDGDCDLKEISCGCAFNDAKEVCLLPNRLVGRAGNGVGEVLMNWYVPLNKRITVATDPSCATVGECTAGRCTRGRIWDVCTAASQCDLPPDTCRVIINWAEISDIALNWSRVGRTNVAGFTPITPGCSRKAEIPLDPTRASSALKLKALGTVDGRSARDRDTFRYRR